MAWHGMGVWTLQRIAPSLALFLQSVVVWLEVAFGQHGGRLYDDDSVMIAGVIHDLETRLGQFLDGDCVANFLEFLE